MKYLWICTLIGAALTASGIGRGNTLQTIVGLVLVAVGFAPLVRRLMLNNKKTQVKKKAEKARIDFLKQRDDENKAREIMLEQYKENADRRYAEITAQEITFDQLIAQRPPFYHYYQRGDRFAAWVSNLRPGERLYPSFDYDLGGYTFDDGIIVNNAIGRVLNDYPHSQVFVYRVDDAPSGTSAELVIHPIR